VNEFLAQFVIESRELVDQAADDLLALEQSPDDRGHLDGVFRAFHTLKGGAGIVEFAAMARAVHSAEDLLAAMRAGEHPVTPDVISNCLACLDQIGRWLDHIDGAGALPDDADAAATTLMRRLASPLAPSGTAPAVAISEGRPAWVDELLAKKPGAAARTAIRYTPKADCFFRGEDPLALIAGLPGLVALELRPLRPWPAVEMLDPFVCNLVIDALSSATSDEVARHLRAVEDQVHVSALAEMDDGRAGRATAMLWAQLALVSEPAKQGRAGRWGAAGRVAANVLRHLGREENAVVVEAALARSLAAGDPAPLRMALEAIVDARATTPTAPQAHDKGTEAPGAPPVIAAALRVDVGRIDAIVNLTGELSVVKNAFGHAVGLAQAGNDPKALAQILKQHHTLLDRLTGELQRSVLAIRVLPLGYLFRRFPRAARDMAHALGKSVRLIIEGEATEADKAVVEVLFDPIMHVLRNAIDHGAETPAERTAAGKPETALLRLRGHREGDRVVIEVTDDGRGIDPGRIRRVAAERGLATADAVDALSDDAAIELIFAPGFSTASEVSDVSGRGVGMDAVRSAIERLGGRVGVESRVGHGTTVRFTLPFSVILTRVMTVEVVGQAFGIPFEAMVETLRLGRDRIVAVGAAEAFVLRGRTVPLLSLARALNVAGAAGRSDPASIVVVEVGGHLSALEVDRFGEQLDVMLKPATGLLAGMATISGTTLLGDGRVLIVLDLQELLQ
jgi:two-component system, chemotaxis family, sensor kinase CheA